MENKQNTEVLKCEKCGANLRVPTDKGNVLVTCPSCRHDFKYEPNITLEALGLDVSIYQEYASLKNEVNVSEASIKRIDSLRDNISGGMGFVGALISCFFIYKVIPNVHVLFWFFVLLLLVFQHFSSLFVTKYFEKSKYKQLQLEHEKLVQKMEDVKLKVEPFEKAIVDYYENNLQDFHSTKLYHKKSSSPDFSSMLEQFDSMLKQARDATQNLLTKHLWTGEYENYLSKRRESYSQGSSDNRSEIAHPTASPPIRTSHALPAEKVYPPEETYRTPRKIDWEKLIKGRMVTGFIGEEMVVIIEQEYLRSIGKNELAHNIRHISKEDGDGSGYDVLSFFPDGRQKYIEVKSTVTSIDATFYISRNEYRFIMEHPKDAFIYRVLLDGEKTRVISLQAVPCSKLLETRDLEPIQYEAKVKINV